MLILWGKSRTPTGHFKPGRDIEESEKSRDRLFSLFPGGQHPAPALHGFALPQCSLSEAGSGKYPLPWMIAGMN